MIAESAKEGCIAASYANGRKTAAVYGMEFKNQFTAATEKGTCGCRCLSPLLLLMRGEIVSK